MPTENVGNKSDADRAEKEGNLKREFEPGDGLPWDV